MSVPAARLLDLKGDAHTAISAETASGEMAEGQTGRRRGTPETLRGPRSFDRGAATGLRGGSPYWTFGDKRALFLRAVAAAGANVNWRSHGVCLQKLVERGGRPPSAGRADAGSSGTA
jgi:hypothetical protein